MLRKNGDHKAILDLDRFTWVRIFSAPAYDSLLPARAWTLTAQHQRVWGYGQRGDRTSWLTHKLEAGGGVAWGSHTKKARAWAIPVAVVGHLFPEMSPAVHGGLGLRSGVLADPHPEWRLILGADFDRWYSAKDAMTLRDIYASASWLRRRESEIRLMMRSRAMSPENRPLTSGEFVWMSYF